jgi:hypothetical protein
MCVHTFFWSKEHENKCARGAAYELADIYLFGDIRWSCLILTILKNIKRKEQLWMKEERKEQLWMPWDCLISVR